MRRRLDRETPDELYTRQYYRLVRQLAKYLNYPRMVFRKEYRPQYQRTQIRTMRAALAKLQKESSE